MLTVQAYLEKLSEAVADVDAGRAGFSDGVAAIAVPGLDESRINQYVLSELLKAWCALYTVPRTRASAATLMYGTFATQIIPRILGNNLPPPHSEIPEDAPLFPQQPQAAAAASALSALSEASPAPMEIAVDPLSPNLRALRILVRTRILLTAAHTWDPRPGIRKAAYRDAVRAGFALFAHEGHPMLAPISLALRPYTETATADYLAHSYRHLYLWSDADTDRHLLHGKAPSRFVKIYVDNPQPVQRYPDQPPRPAAPLDLSYQPAEVEKVLADDAENATPDTPFPRSNYTDFTALHPDLKKRVETILLVINRLAAEGKVPRLDPDLTEQLLQQVAGGRRRGLHLEAVQRSPLARAAAAHHPRRVPGTTAAAAAASAARKGPFFQVSPKTDKVIYTIDGGLDTEAVLVTDADYLLPKDDASADRIRPLIETHKVPSINRIVIDTVGDVQFTLVYVYRHKSHAHAHGGWDSDDDGAAAAAPDAISYRREVHRYRTHKHQGVRLRTVIEYTPIDIDTQPLPGEENPPRKHWFFYPSTPTGKVPMQFQGCPTHTTSSEPVVSTVRSIVSNYWSATTIGPMENQPVPPGHVTDDIFKRIGFCLTFNLVGRGSAVRIADWSETHTPVSMPPEIFPGPAWVTHHDHIDPKAEWPLQHLNTHENHNIIAAVPEYTAAIHPHISSLSKVSQASLDVSGFTELGIDSDYVLKFLVNCYDKHGREWRAVLDLQQSPLIIKYIHETSSWYSITNNTVTTLQPHLFHHSGKDRERKGKAHDLRIKLTALVVCGSYVTVTHWRLESDPQVLHTTPTSTLKFSCKLT